MSDVFTKIDLLPATLISSLVLAVPLLVVLIVHYLRKVRHAKALLRLSEKKENSPTTLKRNSSVTFCEEDELIEADGKPAVAVFSHSLERNGANNFLFFLVRGLCEQYEFEWYSPSMGPMYDDVEDLGVTVGILNPEESGYQSKLDRIVRRHQFVLPNTIMQCPVTLAATKAGTPSLWVIHENWQRHEIDHYAQKVFLMKGVNSNIVYDAFKAAPKLIYPAAAQEKCYEWMVPKSRSRVVYNGIPLEPVDTYLKANLSQRDAIRQNMGYSKDDLVVLHLGTICSRKCQKVTAEAFAQLAAQPKYDNLKLLMVGARYIRPHEVKYLNEIKAVVNDADVTEKVTILDIQKNVYPYYLAADIVVVPSKNEVLPLVVCEAMAFQRPVIATRIAGIPEALTHEQEGLLINPGVVSDLTSSIERLVANPKQRTAMGRRGRVRVETQFGMEKWLGIYDDMIAAGVEASAKKAVKPTTLSSSKVKTATSEGSLVTAAESTSPRSAKLKHTDKMKHIRSYYPKAAAVSRSDA